MLSTIERARRYISKCPVAVSGQQGHNAAFRVVVALLIGFGLSEADTMTLLREWNARCAPPWTEAELMHKVRSVAAVVHSKPRGYLLHGGDGPSPLPSPPVVGGGLRRGQDVGGTDASAKPTFCPMVLKRIAAGAASVGNVVAFILWRSAVEVDGVGSADYLRLLYQAGSGERILLFSEMQSAGQMVWEADENAGVADTDLPTGENGVWFLPQPVDGAYHPNPRQGGRLSRRSEESVMAWRYAILESDEAEPGDWLRCLVQMPLRIASVCESGGRSIHALVRVDAASKADSRVGELPRAAGGGWAVGDRREGARLPAG